MRSKSMLFGVLLLVAGAAAFQLLPAGGGQHYTETVKQKIQDVRGSLPVGGGSSGSASASASTVEAAPPVTYVANFSSTVGAEVELSLSDLLSPSLVNAWTATVELSTGEVCTSNAPLSGFVDPTASIGVISFKDGDCTVTIILAGQGAPTLTPQTNLQNPTDPESLTGSVGLMATRSAIVVGGIINGATASGVPNGSGTMSSEVNSALVSTPQTASGGGTIDVSNGRQNRKANFGFSFSGAVAPKGNFVYHDHITEMVMHSTAVERFVVSGNSATINGTGRVGVVPVQYRLRITDDPDTLDISISGPGIGYSAAGPVQGQIDIAG